MNVYKATFACLLSVALLAGPPSCGGTTDQKNGVAVTDIEEACRRAASCGPAAGSAAECEKRFVDSIAEAAARTCEKTVIDLTACLAKEDARCEEGHNRPAACLPLIAPMAQCLDAPAPDCTNPAGDPCSMICGTASATCKAMPEQPYPLCECTKGRLQGKTFQLSECGDLIFSLRQGVCGK